MTALDTDNDPPVSVKAKTNDNKAESPTPSENDNVSSSFLPSKLSRLSSLGGITKSGGNEEIQRVGNFLRQGALAGFVLWVVLMSLVYLLAPADSYEYLEGPERNANIVVFLLLCVTNGSRLLPIYFRDNTQFIRTGAMIGSCTVQSIAVTSVAIMATMRTPVLMDEVTGRRVHLVRWAEWIPLAFMMTFLTEGIDLPNQDESAVKTAWGHAIALALSTSAGILFPFCHSLFSWIVVFIISMILFMSIYIRLYQRSRRFRTMRRGNSVDEQERYDRVRLSLRLLQACSFMWTLLVVAFTACCFADSFAPVDSWMANPAMPIITESVFEVGSKVWYLMLIVDVHELVFDEGARAVRRLEEMRDLMSVVWDSSSDVIALCVRGKSHINAVVSSTFLSMSDAMQPPPVTESEDKIALFFEVQPLDANGSQSRIPQHSVFAMNMSHPVTQDHVRINQELLHKFVDMNPSSTDRRNIASMASLIAKAWNFKDKELLLMHDLYGRSQGHEDRIIQCEAKITRLESDAIVVVLRDISERFQRFEAEKQLVIEATERKKDAEANRFTRHEVKNGLLAAIGLVDSMRDAVTEAAVHPNILVEHISDELVAASNQQSENQSLVASDRPVSLLEGDGKSRLALDYASCMVELDFTLREVLDTVLSEAMARDVVHEVYEPRKEILDVEPVLYRSRSQTSVERERFPLITFPSPFPRIMLDPQLLRYVHRNAISNACKYGRQGGVVTTEIGFDGDKKEFRMDVHNFPGDRHEDLLQLSDKAIQQVFAAGTRLHRSLGLYTHSSDDSLVSTSAGDGAWIMQKCAKTLGGHCSIKFEVDRTTFSLVCPAEEGNPNKRYPVDLNDNRRFQLPENTWGIAIDDSSIQRKLLDRFLSLAGVRKDKRKVMGKDADEVLGFTKYLGDKIRDNPNDRFLVIVDENLDILDGGAHQKTVSGSLCVKMLRENIDAGDESRLLALVRSANDSSEDIALYKSRAHGFLPKAPIQKDRVLELIQPWWAERFPSQSLTQASRSLSCIFDDGLTVSSDDIMSTLQVIDDLCDENIETALAQRWPGIREKLHALKGDLKTMKSNARVTTILEAMEKLKGNDLPDELLERWKLIKSLIISILYDPSD